MRGRKGFSDVRRATGLVSLCFRLRGEERERGARGGGSLSLVCEHKVVRASVLKSVLFFRSFGISSSNLASVTFPPTPL